MQTFSLTVQNCRVVSDISVSSINNPLVRSSQRCALQLINEPGRNDEPEIVAHAAAQDAIDQQYPKGDED